MIIGFHNPDEDNGYLSNWYMSEFNALGKRFSSVEQYMMYCKAVTFGDVGVASKIMSIEDVATIKRLGREVASYDDHVWNGRRQIVVYEGLCEKFLQNDELKNKLLMTGNAILAECAVKDRIWGIGLSLEDSRYHDIKKWRGQNLLGYTLMMVRSKIEGIEKL